jgi:uncharacterized lipoprotein YmbA
MRRILRPGSTLLACVAGVALAGCVGSSRPSRFYTLSPLDAVDGAAPPLAAADAPRAAATLAVGPVEIPDYLDRQQIVTRTGTNGLVLGDFDRWGGTLDREITRSLVATLEHRLAPRSIAVVPWRSTRLGSAPAEYRAAVRISRFEGVLGRSVVLRGEWELTTRAGDALAARETTVTEAVAGDGYDALVAAMQRALVRFGEEMTASLAANMSPADTRHAHR